MIVHKIVSIILATMLINTAVAQFNMDDIKSEFVLYERRQKFNKYLQEQTIAATCNSTLDITTENNFAEACWAISQFIITNEHVEKGFEKLFAQYIHLQNTTKRSFLEAVYATYKKKYAANVLALMQYETVPKLFAMQAVYMQRAGMNIQELQLLLQSKFPNFLQIDVLKALYNFLQATPALKIPNILDVFTHQAQLKVPIVYSFQRSNRNYAGLAIIQYGNGQFAKDQNGKIIEIQQLARSASNLPYFLTNGSTPQGVFSVVGTDVSKNHFIGPTPNLQLVMPNEDDSLYFYFNADTTTSKAEKYNSLLPETWRSYLPMQQVFEAGKIGRTEIIAHGTTIDPDYFKGHSFYPLTPTLGCLCAKETWNIFNGKIDKSHQFLLANTFAKDPVKKGFLFVIDIDDKEAPVELKDVAMFINEYEKIAKLP